MNRRFATFLATAIIVFLLGFAVWHFGIFPNLVTFLSYVYWITINETSTTALYWTVVFTWLLVAAKSSKLEFS